MPEQLTERFYTYRVILRGSKWPICLLTQKSQSWVMFPAQIFGFLLGSYSPRRRKGTETVEEEQPGLRIVWLFPSSSPWAHPHPGLIHSKFMLITLEKSVSSGKKTLKLQSISPVFRPMIFIFWSFHLLLYRFKPPTPCPEPYSLQQFQTHVYYLTPSTSASLLRTPDLERNRHKKKN